MPSKAEMKRLSYVPSDEFYPEEDGKPIAASDLHRNQLFWTLEALEAHFSHEPSVYVSGDILMYYVQGVANISISPDVLVSFGIGMKLRRTYLVWEEGKVPDFVMEFSSESTYRNDLTDKMDVYTSLGIQNYFLYDAEGMYLPTQLMGFELVDGAYVEVQPGENGGIHASSLGLDFRIKDKEIAIFDPVANDWVRTRGEAAEAENAQLREEIARLQACT